jgi:protein-disulfide isomerase
MTSAGEAPPPRARAFGWKTAIAAGLIGAAAGAAAMAAGSGYFVRSYLLGNPEVIPEAMELLQAREEAKVVDTHRAALETPFEGAWAGARDGDVVLVEFFDYACGYCRKSNPEVDRLLAEDKRLKVVWREWPVLGANSEAAAAASLAAARAGKFKLFYDKLFALGRPTPEAVVEAQRGVGITAEQVAQISASPIFQRELAKNYQLARALNASGTPTFVVGDRIFQGAVGYEALKDAIAEAREGRKG